MPHRPLFYLDQQTWCGLAEGHPHYNALKGEIERAASESKIIVPYSIVHIHELAEWGKGRGISKEARYEKAKPFLQYIRTLSCSRILEAGEAYSKFRVTIRDPFEAFQTVTEVELDAASARSFIELSISKEMVKNVRGCFGVEPLNLNDLSEAKAIERIDRGILNFISRCQSDSSYRTEVMNEQLKGSIETASKLQELAIKTIDEVSAFMRSELSKGTGTVEERSAAFQKVQEIEEQREKLVSEFPLRLEEIRRNTESSFSSQERVEFTFEKLLHLVATRLIGPDPVSRTFLKTVLLDFFGYNSKLSERRSDFYDAMHREHLRAADFFVTDDKRFSQKLGRIDEVIPGTACQLLNLESCASIIKARPFSPLSE